VEMKRYEGSRRKAESRSASRDEDGTTVLR